MTHARSLSAGAVLSLTLATLAAVVMAACGEDGQTANCPELKQIYDVGAAGERNAPEVEAERLRAVDAGCLTDIEQPVP